MLRFLVSQLSALALISQCVFILAQTFSIMGYSSKKIAFTSLQIHLQFLISDSFGENACCGIARTLMLPSNFSCSLITGTHHRIG